MSDDPVLSDLGERRILREIMPSYVDEVGDDCAALTFAGDNLVVTTDPAPTPAANVIAGSDDPFWLGWLLVTINASDIAAAGARPQGFLAALDLPNDYKVSMLHRLLKGIACSCSANGLRYIGGNLREARNVSAVGTAIGSVHGVPLRRQGASPGDLVLIIGRSGQFWSDALHVQSGNTVDECTSPLFSPVSQAQVVWQLHEKGLLKCAMDTSDGLAPTLEELALVNRQMIEVDLATMRTGKNFASVEDRPERLWFGWGDWTVVCAVAPENESRARRLLAEMNSETTVIGRFCEGSPAVQLVDGSHRMRAKRLESERFAPDSWFSKGVQEYASQLRSYPLPGET